MLSLFSRIRLGNLQDVTTSNLSLFCKNHPRSATIRRGRSIVVHAGDHRHTHQFKDMSKLGKRRLFERGIDETTSEEVNRLDTILSIADIAAANLDHANDCLEDGSLQEGTCGKTNGDDDATRTNVSSRLLEGYFRDSEQESSMGTKAILRGTPDIIYQILGLCKIDVGLDNWIECKVRSVKRYKPLLGEEFYLGAELFAH